DVRATGEVEADERDLARADRRDVAGIAEQRLQVAGKGRIGRARIREQGQDAAAEHERGARHESLRHELAPRHRAGVVGVPERRVEAAMLFPGHGLSASHWNMVTALPSTAAHTPFAMSRVSAWLPSISRSMRLAGRVSSSSM